MKALIDTNALYVTRAGTARYVRGLLKGLAALAPTDVSWQPLAWPVENFDYRQPRRALRTLYRELVWTPWRAPGIVRAARADVLHLTGELEIERPNSLPLVRTLLDCSLLRFPERYRRWQRLRGPARMRRMARADRIVCISRFTADEGIQLLGLDARRLEVVHLGSDFDPATSSLVERAPDVALPDAFFLFVGSLEPGKNLRLLRESYLLAERRGIDLPDLVVIGVRPDGLASEGAPPRGWHLLGWQSDEVLLHCFRRALAFVFPTKYEGFGLPLLEAMSLGCPAVCSRVASLPEIGGDAVHYCAQTPEAYFDALHALARDASLRRHLAEAGRAQAQTFSWARCAAETLGVYSAAMRGHTS